MKRRIVSLLTAVLTAVVVGIVQSPAPASATDAPDCWTRFDPPQPAPHAAMTQIYKNCSTEFDNVVPYYSTTAGITVYENGCKAIAPGQTVAWYFPTTDPAQVHSTATCDEAKGPASMNWGSAPLYAGCYTQFDNNAPNGGPLRQFYRNCSPTSVRVTTAWRRTNGNFGAFVWACESMDADFWPPTWEVSWRYGSTIRDASYTTVFCDATTGFYS